jgi:hypothetical protein
MNSPLGAWVGKGKTDPAKISELRRQALRGGLVLIEADKVRDEALRQRIIAEGRRQIEEGKNP